MKSGFIEIDAGCVVRAGGVVRGERAGAVAAMFGLGAGDSERERVIVPNTSIRLGRGRVVFVTGHSGAGKSGLLRAVRERLGSRDDVRVVEFDPACDPDRAALVDRIGESLEQAVRVLSMAGLNDARVMVGAAGQLSEGQRHRWALARCMAQGERAGEGGLTVVFGDEFCSTLDRLTASIVARNVRKWVTRTGVCLVAASAHEDVAEWLRPDVLVVVDEGAESRVIERGELKQLTAENAESAELRH